MDPHGSDDTIVEIVAVAVAVVDRALGSFFAEEAAIGLEDGEVEHPALV